MVQVDILLRDLPREYDITINNKHIHDVIVGDRKQSHDVYIYNLVDRQGIYGDELDPLIFHLTESTIECLLDVSLLDSALLYRCDDRLINSIDDYPVFVLEHGGGYNYFSLKESSIGLRETVYANFKEQITKLKSDVDIALVETMNVEPNNMTLSTSGNITSISVLKTPQLSARLQNQITADISKVCEIMLNVSGVHWFDGYLYEYDDMLLSAMDLIYPKMSLVSTCGNVYIKFSFDIEGNGIGLSNIITGFVNTVNLKDTVRNIMQLKTNADFEYKVVCSCNPVSASLEESTISLKVITYLSSFPMSSELTDWIVQNVRTTTALGVTAESNLETSITEEMEAYYGLGRYDSQYLYYWDDHMISDMSAEIINRSQSGSVDM